MSQTQALMKQPLQNPLLQQLEDKIESQLTPQNQQDYNKIVTAGLDAAVEGGPGSPMASMSRSRDPVGDIGKGAAAMVLILRQHSQGTMPIEAMIPAGMTLVAHGLDFCERTRMIPAVKEPEIERAAHLYSDAMLQAFGISKAGIANATSKVHAAMQDPDAMRKIQLKAGAIADPDAEPMQTVPTAMRQSKSLIN
jgi:hypothetical protein